MPRVIALTLVAVVVASLQLHAQRIPHASEGTKYNDQIYQIYRNLIFNDYDGWSNQDRREAAPRGCATLSL